MDNLNNFDWKQNLYDNEASLSPEEIQAMEDSYQRYAYLVELYQQIIQLEDDPMRVNALNNCLAGLHEDNQ